MESCDVQGCDEHAVTLTTYCQEHADLFADVLVTASQAVALLDVFAHEQANRKHMELAVTLVRRYNALLKDVSV